VNRERLWLAVVLVVLVPAGFFVKLGVPGVLGRWCCLYGAAILYEVFWVVFLRLCFSRLSASACAGIVLVVTCALEVLQLWQPPSLTAIRRTIWGAALLGDTFDKWDFPHYVIGSALGGWLVYLMRASRAARP